MFEIKIKQKLSLRFSTYQVTIKCPDGRRVKRTEAPSMDLAMGLALVANKEVVSEEGSDFRCLLDLAATLDVPGLEAIGAGIRHSLAWTKVHLVNWKLPKFRTEWPFPDTGPDFFQVINTTNSMLKSKQFVRR